MSEKGGILAQMFRTWAKGYLKRLGWRLCSFGVRYSRFQCKCRSVANVLMYAVICTRLSVSALFRLYFKRLHVAYHATIGLPEALQVACGGLSDTGAMIRWRFCLASGGIGIVKSHHLLCLSVLLAWQVSAYAQTETAVAATDQSADEARAPDLTPDTPPEQLPFPIIIEAPDEIAEMLREHLSLIVRQTEPEADIDAEQMQFLAEEAHDEIKQMMRANGYFRPHIIVEPQKGGWRVAVEPNERTTVRDVEVSILGGVLSESDLAAYYKRAMAGWTLPIDQPFVNVEWQGSKDAVLSAVRRYKYPLATLAESRAAINPDQAAAVLSVGVDSKTPVYFGEIEVEGATRYPAGVAEGLAQFKAGDPYDFDKILDYQQSLEQSGHYSRAQVSADFDRMKDGQVPLLVRLSEVPRQKLDLGLRYDSNDGYGMRVGYDHYNVFNRGYIFSGVADIGQYEKSASVGLSQPRDVNGHYWTGNVGYKQSVVQKLDTGTVQGGLWYVRERENTEMRLGVEYLTESRRIINGGFDFGRDKALMFTASWRRQQIDSLLRPANGHYLEGKIGTTLGSLFSSTSIQRIYARAAYYYTPESEDSRKIYGTWFLRGELGYTRAGTDQSVPSDLMFRAGGSGSVRGYEMDSIGRLTPSGAVLPDRILAVASVEYQQPVSKNFSVAVFHDIGSVAHNLGQLDWYQATGIGVRWFSPAVPFSFDIARGHRDGKIRWHISLGTRF